MSARHEHQEQRAAFARDVVDLGRRMGAASRRSADASRRARHRAEMARASAAPGGSGPRYYVTRSGPPACPWRVHRVAVGQCEVIGDHGTHEAALATVRRWAHDDDARARRWLPGLPGLIARA